MWCIRWFEQGIHFTRLHVSVRVSHGAMCKTVMQLWSAHCS